MEVGEKENDGMQPCLFSHVIRGNRSICTLNLSRTTLWMAGLMLFMTYGNLALACFSSFTCSRFLPTLDYLGCFRGHDRLYIISCTYYAVVLSLVVVGGLRRFRGVVMDELHLLMTVTGFLAAFCIPVIAATDEVNAVHWLPFVRIHSVTLVFFFISAGIWTSIAYVSINSLEATLTGRERKWLWILRALAKLGAGVATTAGVEWYFAYTKYANKFLNENVEAACEWALVGLAILLPAVFCQFFRGFGLRFSVQVPGSNKEEGVELAKL